MVGTRYALGGSAGAWTRSRQASSTLATRVAQFATGTTLSDPMSGFFAMRRSAFLEGVRGLSGSGFKILLDIVCSAPRPLRIAEVPFTFRPREAGESKLSLTVVFDYVGLIAEKRTGGWIPARFALFAFVGTLGIAVHMLALYALNRVAGLEFVAAQVGAVLVAMTFNFLLDNRVTYGDRRLRGAAVATGLLRFYLVCGIGAVSNIGVSAFLFAAGPGWFASGLAGAFVAAVFNFAMSSRFVWRGRR